MRPWKQPLSALLVGLLFGLAGCAGESGTAAAPTPAPAEPAPAPAPAPVEAASPPRLIADARPRYPLIALNRGAEGEVVVEARIAADGSVNDARVVSSAPRRIFDRAALDAARQWRFESGAPDRSITRVLEFSVPSAGG